MQIGIIGAGKVGFSLGKYFSIHHINVVGYYDLVSQNAVEAAQFTGTQSFTELGKLVDLSDTLFITTPDGIISSAWDCIKQMSLTNKTICHFSGSLSSVVFSGVEDTGASACSIHPMLAFSDKYSSYRQLQNAFFTIEGDTKAVEKMTAFLISIGNKVCLIDGGKKAVYHTAASILSNQVVAVLDTGYKLLMQCGFSIEDAKLASENLVRDNVENVLRQGTVQALTGPIERCDIATVEKHLGCLSKDDKDMYRILAKKLVNLAQEKNPDKDYSQMKQLIIGKEDATK